MDKKQVIKEIARRELATRSLLHYTSYVFPDFQTTAYQGKTENTIHPKIIEKLEKVERGEITRLMIFMPPRMGKSNLVSKYFPAWCLGKNPRRNIVVSSYGQDLAVDFGRKTKQVVESPEHKNIFPEFSLSKDKKEGGNWETDKGGGYYCVGVGGALTGKGGDILIVDDPVKNREEAESQAIQKRNIEWYTSTLRSRKQSQNSSIIVMMTRWNVNDLAGYLLREYDEEWDVLVIQAIDQEGNEIIWPGKWEKGYMENEKKNMSKKDWAALYQQDPIASSSNIFSLSDIRYYVMSQFDTTGGFLNKEDLRCGIFVDPAFSSNSKSDDAVVLGTGKHKNSGNYYIIDGYADTSAPSKTFHAILQMYDNMVMDGFKPSYISIESVLLSRDQTQFIEDFKKFLRENDRYIIVNTFDPKGMGKKEDRIKFILEPKFSINSVFLRKDMSDRSFNTKIESQLLEFPNGRHDDVIDTLAHAIHVLDKKGETNINSQQKQFYNRFTGKMERAGKNLF